MWKESCRDGPKREKASGWAVVARPLVEDFGAEMPAPHGSKFPSLFAQHIEKAPSPIFLFVVEFPELVAAIIVLARVLVETS